MYSRRNYDCLATLVRLANVFACRDSKDGHREPGQRLPIRPPLIHEKSADVDARRHVMLSSLPLSLLAVTRVVQQPVLDLDNIEQDLGILVGTGVGYVYCVVGEVELQCKTKAVIRRSIGEFLDVVRGGGAATARRLLPRPGLFRQVSRCRLLSGQHAGFLLLLTYKQLLKDSARLGRSLEIAPAIFEGFYDVIVGDKLPGVLLTLRVAMLLLLLAQPDWLHALVEEGLRLREVPYVEFVLGATLRVANAEVEPLLVAARIRICIHE